MSMNHADQVQKEDKIITEFIKSIGPWNHDIIIGGGYALIIYRLYFLNHELTHFPIRTHDIDSLIPRKMNRKSQENISTHLRIAGFKRYYKDYEHPATESYKKEIDGNEIEVEFLTDMSARKDKYKNVNIAGVVAQPLSYLTLSLQNSTPFTTFSNKEGLVVSPGAWIFHKGLCFTKRHDKFKQLKDLYGIWYVASQLEAFSNKALAEV